MNTPHCPAQKQCGACQLLAVPYEKQLERKQHEMIKLFDPLTSENTVSWAWKTPSITATR